ncbi:MAG: sigma-70 family RNA polymerase sigma factor [Phycisphaerales bacterium]
MDSESVLLRVASGDASAVSECMDRFGGLVWSLARRYCNNVVEAEDAVQEIFIDIWKSAARFDESIASETVFVATIARRRLIDRFRKKSRRPESAIVSDIVEAPTTDADAPTEISEDARIASEALAELRPEQQRVLRLSIFHGASHEQIARSTGLPLGTVKTHARRGLIRIREVLEAKRGEAERAGREADAPPGGAFDGSEGPDTEVDR